MPLINCRLSYVLAASLGLASNEAAAQGLSFTAVATHLGSVANSGHSISYSSIVLMGDVNGDGVRDVAMSKLGLAEMVDGATGASLGSWSYPGPVQIASVNDFDGDGISDLMIGAPYVGVSGIGGRTGIVEVVSGATRTVSRVRNGTNDSYFGMSICRIQDVNSDGLDDIVCGANHDRLGGAWGPNGGAVYQVAGGSGSLLTSSAGTGYFGTYVTVGPDVSGDGIQDFVVSRGHNSPGPGFIRVYSGADGSMRWESASTEIYYGVRHDIIEDVSGDGVRDVFAIGRDFVTILSGIDGVMVSQFPLPKPEPQLVDPALARDCSGVLGFPVIAIGWPESNVGGTSSGTVAFVDALTGLVIHEMHGQTPGLKFGASINAREDWDGDGVVDLAVSSGGFAGPSGLLLRVDVFELAPRVLATATPYGQGCGTPALAMVPGARPVIGTSGGARLLNAPTSTGGVTIGRDNRRLGGLPLLPLSLASFGMPGCFLLHSNDVFGLSVTPGAAGELVFVQAIPFDAALVGARIYLQGYCLAPGANTLGVIMSNGIEWQLGNQ